MSTTEDIKANIDIVEYLREQGLQLKQAGQSLKVCCPFHNEKTPSFVVNREKQVWFCFGCSKGGDIFTFVQEREGLEFAEALKLLADRAGVRLEARDPRLEGQKTRSLTVLEETAVFFQKQLQQSAMAQKYTASRNIHEDMLERFQIGYAPDSWSNLTTHLLQKGFRVQEIVDAGIAIQRRQTPDLRQQNDLQSPVSSLQSACYDRFRHRLMFPIHDVHGRIVGFTGRALDGGACSGDSPAKYVNTPETSVYKKGAVVYGLIFAKDSIRESGYAVLVEGQMDVITSHGNSLAQTVAISGTAFTGKQLRILKRFTSRLHFAFDADSAGEGAAERGIDAALDAGFDVRVIQVPRNAEGEPIGKDPDECLRADATAWRTATANPVPVLDYYIARVQERFDCGTPVGKRNAGHVLIARMEHVADPIERAAWIARGADAIGIPESALCEAIEIARRASTPKNTPSSTDRAKELQESHGDPSQRFANRVLALLLRYPDQGKQAFNDLVVDNFPNNSQRELYKILKLVYAKQERLRSEDCVDPRQRSFVERLELFADREFGDFQPASITREIDQCVRELRRHFIIRQLHDIAQRLKTLEQDTVKQHASKQVTELERAFLELTDELSSLHTV